MEQLFSLSALYKYEVPYALYTTTTSVCDCNGRRPVTICRSIDGCATLLYNPLSNTLADYPSHFILFIYPALHFLFSSTFFGGSLYVFFLMGCAAPFTFRLSLPTKNRDKGADAVSGTDASFSGLCE